MAYIFKQDPVAMLSGGDYEFAIRHAATRKILAARAGLDVEEMFDD
jgi:hypothetical protein